GRAFLGATSVIEEVRQAVPLRLDTKSGILAHRAEAGFLGADTRRSCRRRSPGRSPRRRLSRGLLLLEARLAVVIPLRIAHAGLRGAILFADATDFHCPGLPDAARRALIEPAPDSAASVTEFGTG